MTRLNMFEIPWGPRTHEGGSARSISPELALRRSVLACLLWEEQFYEDGFEIAGRIRELVPKVKPEAVAALAVEARSKMKLRHAPARARDGAGEGSSRTGLANCGAGDPARRRAGGICRYLLEGRDAEQAALWKRLIAGELQTPDTWEVALSSGADKRAACVDVSGSMTHALSRRSEMLRTDAAYGLAILLREVCETAIVYSFSDNLVEVPPRRGFALRDAVDASQLHNGTYLGKALGEVREPYDRIIVITDEQTHDRVPGPRGRGYVINVASFKNGVGYGPWTHIDGWSEAVVEPVRALEGGAN